MGLYNESKSSSRDAQQAVMDKMFGWSEEVKRTKGGAQQAKINMMNRLFHGEDAESDDERQSSEKTDYDTLKNTSSHDTLSATGAGQKKRCMCQGCRARRVAEKLGIKLDSNHWRTQPRDEQGRWTTGGGGRSFGGGAGRRQQTQENQLQSNAPTSETVSNERDADAILRIMNKVLDAMLYVEEAREALEQDSGSEAPDRERDNRSNPMATLVPLGAGLLGTTARGVAGAKRRINVTPKLCQVLTIHQ